MRADKPPGVTRGERRRQWRAVAGAILLAAAGVSAAAPNRYHGFVVDNATIPLSEIRSGGPPRDGIPAIDRPRFVRPDQADFLAPDDLVLSLAVGEITRAYPLRILVWHEVVNDQIGDTPVLVTYCPLCGAAMAFRRTIEGRALTFGVSGLLYQSDVLLYDRQTESLWSQLASRAVAGPQVGTPLAWLPTEQLTWAAWRAAHSDGRVLSTQTGHPRDYRREPYARYHQSPRPLFPVPTHRRDLPSKSWVIGVLAEGRPRAYPLETLAQHRAVEEVREGVRLRVEYDPHTRAARVTDRNGRSVPHVFVYWFAWQAFYPDTAVWQP